MLSVMEGVEVHDEPITPAGRFFLQPKMEQVINCAVGAQEPIDVQLLKDSLKDSIMANHPRFRSMLVRDKRGREYWRKLDKIDVEKHVIVVIDDDEPSGSVSIGIDPGECKDDDEVINAYLASLSVSSPLSTDKPLWEIHVLKPQKCCILRLHHSLGDGVSLMSLFLACCRRVGHPDQLPNIPGAANIVQKTSILEMIWKWLMIMLFTLLHVFQFTGRALWVRDKKTVISGGDGVELWPRKIGSARFRLDDMKLVKNTVPKGTINDVLLAVVSAGITEYMNLQSPKKVKDGVQITGLAMVNLRRQPGLHELPKLMENKSSTRWGNQFGFVLVPLYLHKDTDNPIRSLTRAKTTVDRKKQSLEAYFSYRIGKIVMSYMGAKAAALLNRRIVCNTTFTITNVVGPQEEIMFAGNPITFMRVNSTALCHAITMHMLTYNGTAHLQILVAKDIIPDPQVLAKCFEDALIRMKNAVPGTESQNGSIEDALNHMKNGDATATKTPDGTIANGTASVDV